MCREVTFNKTKGKYRVTFNKNYRKIRAVEGELETLYQTKQTGHRSVTSNEKQTGKEKLHSIKSRGNRDVKFNKTNRR